MRVLVTGATGLIGSARLRCAPRPRRRGRRPQPRPRAGPETNPTVSWHAWDPANERPPAAAFEGVDAVVNLVGEKINQRLTDEAKQRIRDSRERATKNLVDGDARRLADAATLVSQSAIGYYGDRGEAIVDESTAAGDGFLAQVVRRVGGRGARGARPAACGWSSSAPGSCSTPMAACSSSLLLPFKLGVGGPLAGRRPVHAVDPPRRRGRADPLGTGQRRRSAASSTRPRPNPVTNREFSKALGRALHRPAVMPAPRLASSRCAARARRADRRQLPGDPAPGARPRLRLPLHRARLRPA